MESSTDTPGADSADSAGTFGQPTGADSADAADMSAHSLSTAQAAAQLGVSERSVRRYIDAGKLPARLWPSDRGPLEWRLRPVDVEAYGRKRTAIEGDVAQKRGHPASDRGGADSADSADSAGALSVAGAGKATSLAVIQAAVDYAVHEATAPLIQANERLQETITAKDSTIERQAEELGRLRAVAEERERLEAKNAHLHDLTLRQAADVAALRAAVEHAKADRSAATLYASRVLSEAQAKRPWWAFWRSREGD